jgi:hypothetical protein
MLSSSMLEGKYYGDVPFESRRVFIIRYMEETQAAMPTRDELKALIDQLPDTCLGPIGGMLAYYVNPPPPIPEIEHREQHQPNYRRLIEKRFRETRKPGTIGSMGGTGFESMLGGVPFGRQGFHYWDEKALVHQSLQSFDGQEIEVMERLSFSDDRTKLICALEISSGGHTVQYQEEFPVSQPPGEGATYQPMGH